MRLLSNTKFCAAALAFSMLGASVVPASAQSLRMGGPQAHSVSANTATPSDGVVGDTGDVPTIDYSPIIGEVKSSAVYILGLLGAACIGITCMKGGWSWVNGQLGAAIRSRR